MKQILNDILEELRSMRGELQFQTKLMKNIFHSKDAKNYNAQHIQKHIGSLIANIGKMKGMDQPEAQKVLGDLMKIIPGGK